MVVDARMQFIDKLAQTYKAVATKDGVLEANKRLDHLNKVDRSLVKLKAMKAIRNGNET